MLELHQISSGYGEVEVVRSVSFTLAAGEILGLMGRNGAGKTTTLRVLATLLQPSGGSATVAGFDILTQARQVRANVGFLATSTALYGRLTARETLAYFGRLNGMTAAVKRLAREPDRRQGVPGRKP